MLLSSEMAGANCVFGGTRVDAGLDTNSNDILEPGEITSTGYVCNSAATPIVLQSGATQGEANASYIAADANAPIELTLPAAPALGDTLAISGAGAGGWVLRQNPGQSILAAGLPVIPSEFSWSALPNQPGGNLRYALASSSDGSHVYALSSQVGFTVIYKSDDGGASWVTIGVGFVPGAFAVSADGARRVVVFDNGTVIYSPNSTGTWSTSPTSLSMTSAAAAAMSADGLRVFAADGGADGKVYRSTNGGANWEAITAVPASGWAALGISADGVRVFALPKGNGQMQQSSNGGYDWSAAGPIPNGNWSTIAVSGNGRYIVAGDDGGEIHLSRDFGTTWEQPAALPGAVSSLAISRDGKVILAGTANGGLYQSGGSHMTWAAVNTSTLWTAPSNVLVALSADGANFFAFANGKPLLSTRVMARSSTGNKGFLAGSAGDAVTLQYVGNGEFIVLRYTSNSGNFVIN